VEFSRSTLSIGGVVGKNAKSTIVCMFGSDELFTIELDRLLNMLTSKNPEKVIQICGYSHDYNTNAFSALVVMSDPVIEKQTVNAIEKITT
jgi:hypothetical protein